MLSMGTKTRGVVLVAMLAGVVLALSAHGRESSERGFHANKRPRQSDRGLPSVRLRTVACQMLGAVAGTAPDRVVVKQNFVRGGAVFGAEVDFIAGWPGSPCRVQAFRVPYLLNDMFFQLDGNLVTEWVGGDRPVVEVFHVGQGGVRLVFKHGSRAGPEYWDSSILINNAAIESDGNYHNTTTEIWKWEGRSYRLLATVPYRQRLEALARLEGKGEGN